VSPSSPSPRKRTPIRNKATHTKTKRRTQAERREATIEKLVNACIAVLAEVGYAGASVKAICARAGVSQGALFRHFETRLELLAHAVDVLGERNLRAFTNIMEQGQEPWSRELIEMFVSVLRDISRSSAHAAWREVVAAARVHAELSQAVSAAVARLESGILRLVDELLPGSPDETLEAATVVLSLMHMFDSEAVTVVVKPNPQIETARLRWAADVLTELYTRRHAGPKN
jgi:AcrR family transcriptional regulator